MLPLQATLESLFMFFTQFNTARLVQYTDETKIPDRTAAAISNVFYAVG